ncbi:MAG: SCO family protein [Deltaproteobacteria bacterium]
MRLVPALLFAVTACRAAAPRAPLPVLGRLPAFELTDQGAGRFGSAELHGAPYVADFVYTGCHESCPLLTSRMAGLAAKLSGTSVRLVTFTVDPARDTPERLRAYGEQAGADFSRWRFLTGSPEALRQLLVHGFRVTMGAGERDDPGNVLHDEHLVLADGEGEVRGYYTADADGVHRLADDARALASMGPPPQGPPPQVPPPVARR